MKIIITYLILITIIVKVLWIRLIIIMIYYY